MGWQSSAPSAIAALISLLDGALTGVDVRDGPEIGDESAHAVVTIGWSGDAQGTAVTNQPVPEGLAASRDREKYAVHCMVSVNQDDTIANVTAAAYQLLGDVGVVIAANRRLNGVVLSAYVGVTTLERTSNQLGVTANLLFDVECDAYTIQ